MMRNIVETLIGNLDDKRRWRHHKARVKALPGSYRTAAEAIERYLLRVGAFRDGQVMLDMLEDLDSLFEQAVADGTPVRSVVGQDPGDFAETFLASYAGRTWIDRERDRLNESIARTETTEESDGSDDVPGDDSSRDQS